MPAGSKAISRHIAFLIPDLGGGGAERVAIHLAEGMTRLGHRLDIVVLRRGGELEALLPRGARLIDLQAPRLRSALWPLVRYLKRERPEGLLAFMWPLTVIAVLACTMAQSGTRLVLADHCTLSKHYPASRHGVIRATMRLFYPRATDRIMVSQQAAGDAARLSGLPRSAFDVITNPVPLPPKPSAEAFAAAGADWPASGLRILTVGSLKPEKNHALLLRAFALLVRDREAQLLILGEGPERVALQELAQELRIADRVALPGFRLDATPYYRSADMFVLSSDNEGLPLVLVEALHAGLRIVSTDCPSGPREILDDGRFGVLVPTADVQALAEAIRKASDQPSEPGRQRERARAFSGEQATRRYLQLLLGPSAEESAEGFAEQSR